MEFSDNETVYLLSLTSSELLGLSKELEDFSLDTPLISTLRRLILNKVFEGY